MPVLRSLAVALLVASTLGISCYSEPQPPSTYLYACDGDAECGSDEECRRGRCVRPCTLLTSLDDCGEAGICFNGACSSTCEVGADNCPGEYECIDLGLDLGGGGGLFGGGASGPVGICGIQCNDDDDICPEGEACSPSFEGVPELEDLPRTCATDCTADQVCPAGYACFPVAADQSLCVPEDFEIPMGSGAALPDDEVPR